MKLFYFIIAACLVSYQGLAQTDNPAASAEDSSVTKASLTMGASYSNNANYYGQKAAVSIPYLALAATYKLKCGLYFSGLGYKLLHDSGTVVSAVNAGAGINFKLSKRLSADISYSHSFYPAYSLLLQAGNPDNAGVSLTYENWLSSKVNLDYAFGKTTDLFLTAGTGKQISLGSIGKKDVVTITPSFDVVAGTQRFYQTYLTEKHIRDSVLGTVLGPVLGPPADPDGSSRTTVNTQFNVLSYNFKCPVAYNRAHYLFEIAYQLSVLSKYAQSNAKQANSFVSASFYYQF